MLNFSRFLIEKKFASERQVLDALVASIESQPALCTIVRDLDLLPLSNQIATLEYQSAHSVSYSQALRDLNYWNDALEKAVQEYIEQHSKSFTDVLLNQGLVDFPTLIRAFDEFVMTVRHEQPVSNPQNIPKSITQALDETDRVDIDKFDRFGNQFDIARYGLMTSMINDWNSFAADARGKVINALVGEWESIRQAATDLGSAELSTLLESGIYMLHNSSAKSEAIGSSSIAHLTTIALNVTHIAWAIRERLIRSKNLSLTTDDMALKFRYETILSAVRTIRSAA